MKEHLLANVEPVTETVRNAVLQYFRSLGREIGEIKDDTDLIRGTGASSDEGVDFAIDLCDAIGAEVPFEFNPFVHPSGNRGMKFRELVECCQQFITGAKGVADGG